MLLDDSVEFDYFNYSASAEPLPMNWDIELPKVWIPSSLLPNRKKEINPNKNKPFVLHTLEKPDYSNTFSVYADECLQHHKSQTSCTFPSKISHPMLRNNNIDELHLPQALSSSQNTVEWDERSDIENQEDIFQRYLANNNTLDDSLKDSQQAYVSMIRNTQQCGEETSDLAQEAKCKATLEDMVHRLTEILLEDQPCKQNWHYEDTIKTNQVTSDSTLVPSAKDSLEEIYFSDDNENQFDIEEYKIENLEIPSLKKEDSCNIQELPSESFVNNHDNGLELGTNNSDKTAHQPFEETEEISKIDQKESVDNAFNQSKEYELNKTESIIHTKDFEQELQNSKGESNNTAEKIVEFFPFAYKRPALQEHNNKIKPQKEKKKTKKAKKNLPLEDLFLSEEVDRFKIPEIDEFYENLVRQGKCKPRDEKTNMDSFPFESFPEELPINYLDSTSNNILDNSQNLFWDSAQKLIESMNCKSQSNYPDKIIRKDEKVELQHEMNVSLDTLIIDNIPLNVSKENIESFILGYGELKNLIVERHGKFQRAKLQMDFICDVDWIIDCLNDSQPFGSSEAELIKCYRQT